MLSKKITIKEICVFAVLSALMFGSKVLMEILPNIHLITMFIVAFTAVFRKKALIPIYTFVFLEGIFSGFSMWWLPYLYIWIYPFALTLLVPAKLDKRVKAVLYIIISASHGFLYGALYAPAQALMFSLNFKATLAWIVVGLPFDLIHGISNIVSGFLITPLISVLKKITHNGGKINGRR